MPMIIPPQKKTSQGAEEKHLVVDEIRFAENLNAKNKEKQIYKLTYNNYMLYYLRKYLVI